MKSSVRKSVVAISCISAFAAATTAFAAGSAEFSSNAELRLLRREAVKLGGESTETGLEVKRQLRGLAAAPAEEKVSWTAGIGLGYTRGQDGSKTWVTPFEIDATLNDSHTTMSLSGDGYGHTTSDAGNASGFNDATFSVSRSFPQKDKSILGVGGAVTVPAGGEMGGSSAKQRVSASYMSRSINDWRFGVVGKLVHINAEQPSGVSQVGQGGVLQAKYKVPNKTDTDLVLQLARSYRSGAGGGSQFAAAYSFPFTAKMGGSLAYSRGLTEGSRDNSVEFDLSYSF